MEKYGIRFQFFPKNCAMLIRNSAQRLKDLMGRFKAVAVVGPRQSGKTTLVRKIYNRKPYVLVEEADDLLPVEIKAGHTISSEFLRISTIGNH